MNALSTPRVKVVPLQPHCFAFGGFELQMLSAMSSAQSAGADIGPLDFWNKNDDFEILHVWGFDLQHQNLIKWAKLADKKIILSALFPYRNVRTSFRNFISGIFGPAKKRRLMLDMLDGVTVVNSAQKEYLSLTLKYPSERIHVIPNIVDDKFYVPQNVFSTDSNANLKPGYVLCTGNICPRKNQIALANACKKAGVRLILVGDVLLGDEHYGGNLAEVLNGFEGAKWIRKMPAASEGLVELYRNASVFALPSFSETQPISALEAKALGIPLVLANLPYAHQEFYEGAILVNPRSIGSIAQGIARSLEGGNRSPYSSSMVTLCKKNMVGAAYRKVYEMVYRSKF